MTSRCSKIFHDKENVMKKPTIKPVVLNEYLSEDEEERISNLVDEIFPENLCRVRDGILAFSLMAYYVEGWGTADVAE